ncbi:MAG: glycosyltransferase [Candidatus Bathyarchaeia archaeon]
MDEMIKRDLETYKFLKSKAEYAFNKGYYEQALDYIYLAATLAWQFHIGIWYDDGLEHLLLIIGKRLTDRKNTAFRKANEGRGKRKKAIYIVSHLYDVGGHSRILTEWANLLSDFFNDQHVYVTNVTNGPTVSPYMINKLKRKVAIKQFIWWDSYTNRIKKLTELIEAESPDAIILFIHPNDIIAVSSLLALTNKPHTIFFNHSDHTFWLGRNVADLVVEWRVEGARLSKKFRKIDRIAMVPLITTIKPKKMPKTIFGIPETATVSISIGSFYKVIGNSYVNYFKTMEKLLNIFPNHYHLFVTTPPPKNVIKKYLPVNQDVRKRFLITGPYKSLEPIYGVADFLIETFPLSGGTIRLEAIASGLPIVAFQNEEIPFTTKIGMLPPNYPFLAYTAEDIVNYSSGFIQNQELRSKTGAWLYEYYKQNFGSEKTRKLLINILAKKNFKSTDVQLIDAGKKIDYDIATYRRLFSQWNHFLKNKMLLRQALSKSSKFSLRDRIRFYVDSLKNYESKSIKTLISGTFFTFLGWRVAILYWLLKSKILE